MKIIGVTGSIATGKSTVSALIQTQYKALLFDADAEVHALYEAENVIRQIQKLFPDVVEKGKVNRARLGDIVFKNKRNLQDLQQIIHPLVRERLEEVIAKAVLDKETMLVLDIPLLFENNLSRYCDLTIVTDCPPAVQQERALLRKGMTLERFQRIVANQWTADKKKAVADVVIDTTASEKEIEQQLSRILQ